MYFQAYEKDNIFLIAKRSVQTSENRKEQKAVRSSRGSTFDLSRSDKNEFLLNLRFRIRPFLSSQRQTITETIVDTGGIATPLLSCVAYRTTCARASYNREYTHAFS